MNIQCVGVSWYYGQYGPLGAAAGSECFLHWEMTTSDQSSDSRADSARLHNETLGHSMVISL
jgi:hypothetical protein